MDTNFNIDYAKVATRLASVLGRKYGVSIVFSGDEASTNGSLITLPHWDMSNPRNVNALYGLVFHEAAGHVRHTDFAKLSDETSRRRQKQDAECLALWHAAANILEDIRVERKGIDLYPGAKASLNSVCDVVFENYPAPGDLDNHWALALNWSILAFRTDILGQTVLRSLAQSYTAVAQEAFGADTLVRAMDLARAAATAPGVEMVFLLADDLISLFDQAGPASPSQPAGSQDAQDGPDARGNPCASQDSSEGNGSSDAHHSSANPSQGSLDASHDRADGSEGTDPSKDDTGSLFSVPGDPDGRGGSKGSPDEVASQQANGSGQPGATRLDRSVPGRDILHGYDIADALCRKAAAADGGPGVQIGFEQAEFGPHSPRRASSADVTALMRAAAPLRSNLAAAVSPMLCGDAEFTSPSLRGRTLESRRIARIRTDSRPCVWKTLMIEEDQSVAVQILVDTSGSTSGSVLQEETKAALALASALEQFPLVETAVSHFPGHSLGGSSMAPFLKPFDMPVALCLRNWPSAAGGTPLADAYYQAFFNFLHSERDRKILFVMTDGKPNDADKAAKAHLWLRDVGVETYGIVIGDGDYPAHIFDDEIRILSVSELSRALMALVMRHI